jgi:polyferredoxin
MGEEMPKTKTRQKKKDYSRYLYYVAIILIVILFLKGFGVLKVAFNIDPDGITYNIDIGYITSAVLFGIVIQMFHKQNGVLSHQGERIARIEGILENQNKKS